MPNFLEKDTLFRINAAKMHRSIAAKEVHIARYLFWGSGGKVCGYIVVLGRWWQATTAGDAVSLSASTNQPTGRSNLCYVLAKHLVREVVSLFTSNRPIVHWMPLLSPDQPLPCLLFDSLNVENAALVSQRPISDLLLWLWSISYFRTGW